MRRAARGFPVGFAGGSDELRVSGLHAQGVEPWCLRPPLRGRSESRPWARGARELRSSGRREVPAASEGRRADIFILLLSRQR